MTRLLYILTGPVPPHSDPAHDKFKYLSEIAEGEVLLPVWWDSPKSVPPFLQDTFPTYRVGNFRYHQYIYLRFPKALRRLAVFLFYLKRGLQLHREKKFDVIVTYGTNRTGIVGVILKWITGAKLIVEIPGVPEDAFRYDVPHPGIRSVVKRFFADQLLVLVGVFADCIKLLYPWQLRKYPCLFNKKVAVFHDFVPVHSVRVDDNKEPIILLVGFPWYTKGADVLIRAFKLISAQFPNYKLKLMGYYPDREVLNDLAADFPQIEFLTPVPYDLSLKTISNCSIYVSASRTEGMPRVLLEAMAARRPIVAAAVGGVPHCIEDNDNGLLFRSEDVGDLAEKLVALLTDPRLQDRLAERGYEKVFSEYDERAYVGSFDRMLKSVRDESLGSYRRSDRYEGMLTKSQ